MIAASPAECYLPEVAALFAWATEQLFAGRSPLPGEFLMLAKHECYAVTNYRLVHRDASRGGFQLIPLSTVRGYQALTASATTRTVVFDLETGSRVVFNGVRAADVIPEDAFRWVLAAQFWTGLDTPDLQALQRGKDPEQRAVPFGAAVPELVPAAESPLPALQGPACSACRGELLPGDRYCRGCGSPVEQGPPRFDASVPQSAVGSPPGGSGELPAAGGDTALPTEGDATP